MIDDMTAAREEGRKQEEHVAENARDLTGFDLEKARARLLLILEDLPATSGEVLVDMLKEAGFRPHDDRAFGAVFSRLARRGLIRSVGNTRRKRGHGTAGARVWEKVQNPRRLLQAPDVSVVAHDDLVKLTWDLESHPEGWEHPCACRECRSS